MKDNSNRVTIELVGGVGNQLFQYFAAKYVATLNSSPLTIDKSRIGIGGTRHSSSVSDFLILDEVNSSRSKEIFFRSIFGRVHNKLSRTSVAYRYFLRSALGIYQSPTLDYDQNLEILKPPVKINGYFQTIYFYQKLLELKPFQLQLRGPSEWYFHYRNLISSNRSLIIHVRRGDYIALKDSFGLLTEGYYREAIEILSNRISVERIFIFSDDISEARKMNWEIHGQEVIFVDPPHESSASESLMLMSYGSAIVLSNSTFAWWAAVLGEIPHVVGPSEWFRNAQAPQNLMLKEWIEVNPTWQN